MPDLRTGMAIKWQGEVYLVLSFQHTHMGRGSATTRAKLKNVLTGQVREVTFRDADEYEEVRIERKPAILSYIVGNEYHFLDNETYEDIAFTAEQLGEDVTAYLKEGDEVTLLYAEDRPLTVELPTFVVLEVVETDPGVRGDTASGGSKPAKLETGKVIQVPLFVKEGDKVKVDTRTGKYIERV
ncbi:MAG: elongation factor P [Candidatus Hydrothermota bacterium]|nr:MAG: elongation factor P [Candidatus Hydrothermae bacterium]